MKVIEFIGLPGSGKSTLTPMVKRFLREQGGRVFDSGDIVLASLALPGRGFWHRVTDSLPDSLRRQVLRGLTKVFVIKPKYRRKFKSEYPELFSYVRERTENRSIPEAHRLLMMRWFLNLGAYYMISQETQERAVVILEEGFVHKAMTFFITMEGTHTDAAAVARYLDLIPVPDVLVKIAADGGTCRQRLNGRALPRRLRESSETEIANYFHRAETVLEQAEQTMVRRGCPVVTLNNTHNGVAVENMRPQLVEAFQAIDEKIGVSSHHA